jgi:hypothetical protein
VATTTISLNYLVIYFLYFDLYQNYGTWLLKTKSLKTTLMTKFCPFWDCWLTCSSIRYSKNCAQALGLNVGVAATAAYDTTFLLWTNDYCVEFFPLLSSTFHQPHRGVIVEHVVISLLVLCSCRSHFTPRRTILFGIHTHFLYIKQLPLVARTSVVSVPTEVSPTIVSCVLFPVRLRYLALTPRSLLTG